MIHFLLENEITLFILVFVVEVLFGMLAQSIATGKGHPRKWFLAGFFLSFIGAIWAAGLPDKLVRDRLTAGKSASAAPVISAAPEPVAAMGEEQNDTELAAVLAAVVAALGEAEGKKFIMRSFRPAGASQTPWARAGRA